MTEATLEEVTRLADQLRLDEKRALLDHLAQQVRADSELEAGTSDVLPTGKAPRSLAGLWEGRYADDFDLDAELHEIRHAWEEELELLDP
jgi:hypothetical protein